MKYLVLGLSFLTASCASQSVYLSPEISGQVFDSTTGNTLNNQGIIFTVGPQNNSTDSKGNFHLEAFQGKMPNMTEKRMMKQTVNFNFNGYEFKTVDYSIYLKEPLSYDQKSEINIGKVYLDRKK